MHAALILFDVCFAFRARFGVYFKPVARIGLLIATNSVDPGLKQFAVNRRMRLLQTAEAEVLSAVAKAVNSFAVLSFNYAVALLARTPLCLLRKIHKRLICVFFELFEKLRIKQAFKNFVRNYVFTLLIRALGEQTLGSLLNFCLAVALEALDAQLVAAVRHRHDVGWLVLAVAGLTHKEICILTILFGT